MEIVRRGRAVAILKVVTLGAHQSTCEITSRPIPLRAGDSARFLPSGRPTSAVAVAPPPAPPVPGPPVFDSTPVAQPSAPAAAVRRAPTPVRPTTRIVTPAPGQLVDSAPAVSNPTAPIPAARDTTRPVVTKPAPRPPPQPVAAVPVPASLPPPRSVAATPTARPAPPSPPPVARQPIVAAAPVPARSAPAPVGSSARGAQVTFVSSSSAYVNAGKAEGLAEGSRVDVVRRGRSVAELKVSFLSTHQAACQIVSVTDSVVVGDSVRYVPVALPADSAAAIAAQLARPSVRPAAQRSRPNPGRLRGRVGLSFLTVQQRDSFGGRLSQPSGDFRLNGVGIGGSPIGLSIDVRSRRSVKSPPGSPTTTTDQTRIYQAVVFWQAPGSPLRFTTGRQYAPGIASVGLLDGAAAELNGARMDFGLFGGMQPEPASLGFASEIGQLGGYLRLHSRATSLRHWSATVGMSGSYHTGARDSVVDGRTNREFGYLQVNYLDRRLSIYAVQEIDYYRWWRHPSGGKAVSPTSTFANVQLQVARGFSLTTGVDNRRSVRLYSDFVNPTTTFDDTFRRGVWAGFTTRVGHYQAAFDARTSHDSSTGTANTYTLALGADRLTPLGISLRSRSSRFTTRGRQGWLNSISLGLEPFGRGSLQLTSGWRSDKDTSAAAMTTHWFSADMDVTLLRSLFMIVSAHRERGGISSYDLLYTGVSFRF